MVVCDVGSTLSTCCKYNTPSPQQFFKRCHRQKRHNNSDTWKRVALVIRQNLRIFRRVFSDISEQVHWALATIKATQKSYIESMDGRLTNTRYSHIGLILVVAFVPRVAYS